MKKTAIMAVAVAAGATLPLFATIVDTFEESNAWTGGEIKAETYTSSSAILPTTAAHTKFLAFEGSATRTISGESGANIIDMMCKIAALEDEPSTYSINNDALFAIAVAPDRKLQIYCKPTADGTAAFTTIDDTVYDADAWVRITVAIDYTATPKSFQLAVNGTIKPATYYLANSSATTITSVKAIGTSSIDDFVVKNDANNALDVYAQVDANGDPVATTVDGVAVPNAYLTKTGKSAENVATATIPNSTLTYLKAYLAGVEPTSGATFSVTQAQVTDKAVTLSFPGSWPANTYTIKYGSAPNAISTVAKASTATKEGDTNKVTVPLSFSGSGTGTLYFSVSR